MSYTAVEMETGVFQTSRNAGFHSEQSIEESVLQHSFRYQPGGFSPRRFAPE